MAAKSRAEVRWQGDLRSGGGQLTPGSAAFPVLPLTFAVREQPASGKTNPEELMASAHAACYSMALSNALAQNKTPANVLHVTAEATLDRIDGALKITTMDLTVRGDVPGLDQSKFDELAHTAEERCPVSNALRNNVQINLHVETSVGV